MLLNIVAPVHASAWDMDEVFPASGLHFEQNRHDFFENITGFHFIATDETNDNADSENEDIDPSPKQGADTAVPWLSYTHHRVYSLNSREHSLFARSHTLFTGSDIPLYIQQRVLRL